MKLPPEVNLLAVAHYLQALEIQRKANQVVAILGSKTPQHPEPGGGRGGQRHQPRQPLHPQHGEALPGEGRCSTRSSGFVTQCYLVDVAAVAGFYPDWFKYGAGVTNYLAVPDMPTDAKMTQLRPARRHHHGRHAEGPEDRATGTTTTFKKNVTESIAHSYYDGDWQRAPVGGGDRPQVQRRVEGGDRGPREVLAGSRRRGSTASRCRSARWPRCWSASSPATPLTVKYVGAAIVDRQGHPQASTSPRPCSTPRSAATRPAPSAAP